MSNTLERIWHPQVISAEFSPTNIAKHVAPLESAIANGLQVIWQTDLSQIFTSFKHTCTYCSEITFTIKRANRYRINPIEICKCIGANI